MILTKTPLRVSFVGGGSDRRLLDMLPVSALHNRLNAFACRVIPPCKLSYAYTLFILLAHIADVLFRKAGFVACFTAPHLFRVQSGVVLIAALQSFGFGTRHVAISARLAIGTYLCGVTSLLMHVLHVVFCGSEKQMTRVAAGAIVAAVKHKQVIRNSAVGQFIGDAVRKQSQALMAYLSIPMTTCAQFPGPTIIDARYLNTIPEALRRKSNGGILGHVGSSFPAIGHATGVTAPRGFVMPNYTMPESRSQ